MPFCTHCGNSVAPTAVYCAKCGAQQFDPRSASHGHSGAQGEDYLRSLSPTTASTLCYLPFFGWVPALLFLTSQRFREDRLVRFHAFQGMYMSVVWLLVDIAMGSMFGFAGFAARRAVVGSLKLAIVCGWVYMLYKTASGELIRLPFLGELAERSVTEQSSSRP